MGRSWDWKEECKVTTWMQKVQHCTSTLLAVQQMDKKPGKTFPTSSRTFHCWALTKAEWLPSARSISIDLKHQLWISDSPSGHDGDFERTQKWKTLISLQPFTLGTLSLLQFCSRSVILNITSDFHHFLYGCTSKERADPVFQRNLYVHFLDTLLLGHLNC